MTTNTDPASPALDRLRAAVVEYERLNTIYMGSSADNQMPRVYDQRKVAAKIVLAEARKVVRDLVPVYYWKALDRLQALARDGAISEHIDALSFTEDGAGHFDGEPDDDDRGFTICPHPDCKLVRELVPVPPAPTNSTAGLKEGITPPVGRVEPPTPAGNGDCASSRERTQVRESAVESTSVVPPAPKPDELERVGLALGTNGQFQGLLAGGTSYPHANAVLNVLAERDNLRKRQVPVPPAPQPYLEYGRRCYERGREDERMLAAEAVPPAPSGAPAPATIVEPGLIQLARKRCEQYRVDGYDSLADAVWNFAHECVRLLPKRSSWVAAPAPSALEKEG